MTYRYAELANSSQTMAITTGSIHCNYSAYVQVESAWVAWFLVKYQEGMYSYQ